MDEKVDEKVDEASQSPAASLRPKIADTKGATEEESVEPRERRIFPKGNSIKQSRDGVAARYRPHAMRSFQRIRGLERSGLMIGLARLQML